MFKSKITTVVAVTALVVAVFGPTPLGEAAARVVVPKNSVGTSQLKKSAVTGLKVKNGTLMAADFKAGQLPVGPQGSQGEKGEKGDTGAPGQTGAQGPKGDKGDAGALGTSGYEIVSAGNGLAPGEAKRVVAFCPAGKKALGGGYASGQLLETQQSYPGNGNGWDVVAKNTGNGSTNLFVYAVCANVG